MAKVKITPAFRARLSDKLMDLGNYVAVGLIIGQFVAGQEFSEANVMRGVIGTAILYSAAYIISP